MERCLYIIGFLTYLTSYVIQRHSVVSLVKSLKFIIKPEYTLVYKYAKGNLSP